MRLWRLTRTSKTALDGAGASKHGGRYSPPGARVVNFASEPGLAVLVALRYLPGEPADAPNDYVLGWTEIDAIPERAGDAGGDAAIRDWVADWLEERRSLLAAVRSQVLPEADVVLMNPLHPDAARVRPLVTRPYRPPLAARPTAGAFVTAPRARAAVTATVDARKLGPHGLVSGSEYIPHPRQDFGWNHDILLSLVSNGRRSRERAPEARFSTRFPCTRTVKTRCFARKKKPALRGLCRAL